MPTEPFLSCTNVIALLDDYLDDELPAESASQIQQHLNHCKDCRSFADSYRDTVKLARATGVHEHTRIDVPNGLSERIVAALKRRF